jgi:hypothetical protein
MAKYRRVLSNSTKRWPSPVTHTYVRTQTCHAATLSCDQNRSKIAKESHNRWIEPTIPYSTTLPKRHAMQSPYPIPILHTNSYSPPSQPLTLLLRGRKPLRPLRLRVLVRIQLGPDFLDVLPLLQRLLAVLPCALEAQPAQAHVHPVLCVGAVPRYFP